MKDTAIFKKALKTIPRCIKGFDYFVHKSPADLAWLVLLQVDLYKEGDDSEIKTISELRQCELYVARYYEE